MPQLKFTILLLLFAVYTKAQTININGPAGSGQFGKTVTVLTNGNYVVTDPSYDEGSVVNVGAVYLYNGSTHALISTLKGSKAHDSVGSRGVTTLTNGNFVVCSQYWDNGEGINSGAVTWGNGSSGLSGEINSSNSLVGNLSGENVGSGGALALSNGNYLVISPGWRGNQTGAVTWGNGLTGVSGIVSNSNSLVGSTGGDRIANYPIVILKNGNYVVVSPYWNNGAAFDAGAITWGDANTGVVGEISSSISLVGTSTNDHLGYYWDLNLEYFGVTALSNGNYVVVSPLWDNGAVTNAGAVTLCNGTTGTTGVINSGNSLVGSKAGDMIGHFNTPPYGATALNNGNYVVVSQYWDNGAVTDVGAATWGSGITGVTGVVSSSNSLIGNNPGDSIGEKGVTALSNGNYVVVSPYWHIIPGITSGAVTWGNGMSGISGVISASNSLVSNSGSGVGDNGVTALSNGNYVVSSAGWDNGGASAAGAVTWGNGTSGTVGFVNSSNSLVGSKSMDMIGYIPFIHSGVTALNNGNYVVASPSWDNGNIVNAGAATWCNGTTGTVGVVSTGNSLVGSNNSDRIGYKGIVALNNGNYVVSSPVWNNADVNEAGAATWGNGITGTVGVVGSGNSLVGSKANDRIGASSLTGTKANIASLSNGNFVVYSPFFDNELITNTGAATWGNGATGTVGVVSASNSLVGSNINDSVGSGNTVLDNGNYVVSSPKWDYGAKVNAGAITQGNGSIGVAGIISGCNSITGTASSGGASMNFAYNNVHAYLMVGRPSENVVSVYIPNNMTLAVMQDSISQNIYSLTTTPLIASGGCRILATLTPNGASPVSGTVNAKVWIESTVPTYGNPFVARHYEITPITNASTATARLTLYFIQQEFDDFNAHAGSALDLPTGAGDAMGIANLRIGKYAGSSSNGSGFPGTYPGAPVIIDPNDADIVWNNSLSRWEISFDVTGFSGFVVQTKATPLPLQWLSFSASLSQNDVLVRWSTTNEINTKNFEVERSTDGRNFATVGTVTAINNTGDNNYNFTDAGAVLLNNSKLYYRLKQIDHDGRYSNSQIVLLHLSKSNSITVYPNPVNSIATLSFSNKDLLNTAAVLCDMQGKRIKQFIIQNFQEKIDMSELYKGVYILKLADGTGVKLIKN